jgi:hypothetical protein
LLLLLLGRIGRRVHGQPAERKMGNLSAPKQPAQMVVYAGAKPLLQFCPGTAAVGLFDQCPDGMEQIPVPGETQLLVHPQAAAIKPRDTLEGYIGRISVDAPHAPALANARCTVLEEMSNCWASSA